VERLRVERRHVIAEARTWLGVPFLHQGRSRRGIDCSGLVIVVARELGLSRFDVTGYPRKPDGTLRAHCDRELLRAPLDGFGLGDVLLFRDTELKERHLAIVGDHPAGGFTMIHSYARNERVVEARLDEGWLHFLAAAYRLPGVA
jgi:cell wall-associated NlpC family hydrolase